MAGLDQAVDLECAWYLMNLDNIGIAPLLAGQGGPFDVVQAYAARIPKKRSRNVFLWIADVKIEPLGFNMKQYTYDMVASVQWALLSAEGAEDDQRQMMAAMLLLYQRIIGPQNDKTHNGAFVSAGTNETFESPGRIETVWKDPFVGIQNGVIECDVHYPILDSPVVG